MGVVVFVVGRAARARAVAVSILWSLMVAAAVCVHGDGAGGMGGTSSGRGTLVWHRGQMARSALAASVSNFRASPCMI